MKKKPKPCEICGYRAKSSTMVVQKCKDGIWRCHVCREKAMFGEYVPEREWLKDPTPKPQKETDEWKQYMKDLKDAQTQTTQRATGFLY